MSSCSGICSNNKDKTQKDIQMIEWETSSCGLISFVLFVGLLTCFSGAAEVI